MRPTGHEQEPAQRKRRGSAARRQPSGVYVSARGSSQIHATRARPRNRSTPRTPIMPGTPPSPETKMRWPHAFCRGRVIGLGEPLMKSARVGEKRRSMTTGGRRLRNRAIGSRLQWLMLTCAATTSAMATSQLAAAADIDRDDATASALSRSWATETPAHQFSAFSPADGPGSRPRSGRPPETAIAASEGPISATSIRCSTTKSGRQTC